MIGAAATVGGVAGGFVGGNICNTIAGGPDGALDILIPFGAAVGTIAGVQAAGVSLGSRIATWLGRLTNANPFFQENLTNDGGSVAPLSARCGLVASPFVNHMINLTANTDSMTISGVSRWLLPASSLASSIIGGIIFMNVTNKYFKPGEALQQARDALFTLHQNEEQAPQILESLKETLTSHEEIKTSLQRFFQRLRGVQESSINPGVGVSAAHYSPQEIARTDEARRNIGVLNAVETILIQEIDQRIAGTQDLIPRLEGAIQRRALQKKENTDWKGTNPSDGSGPRYRRPGL